MPIKFSRETAFQLHSKNGFASAEPGSDCYLSFDVEFVADYI